MVSNYTGVNGRLVARSNNKHYNAHILTNQISSVVQLIFLMKPGHVTEQAVKRLYFAQQII